MTGRSAACPSCGAPIEFRNAATVLVVCASCGGASFRRDMDLEKLGVVAEVTPIDSLLELGATGRIDGKGWSAVGQVQLDHGAGPWNEWCLLFDDGSWGWLAEAQGELLFTRPVKPGPVPPWDRLQPGDPVDLGKDGLFVVAERGEAKVTAVRGEIPIRVPPGSTRFYADLRSGEKGFATLDYGDDRKCDQAYLGRSLAPSDAGIDFSRAPVAGRPGAPAERIRCPHCGGEIRLRDPEGAMRVGCQSCGKILDPRDPKAALVGIDAKIKSMPSIPLGQKGRLRGLEVEVIAFLVRSVTVDGTRYPWREYLLKAAKGGGYRWLAEANQHWALLEPVSPGALGGDMSHRVHGGTEYAHFQSGAAVVDRVLGEVYWEVTVGEKVQSHDYVAPPRILSVEKSGKEIHVTVGSYVPPEEVRDAFGLKRDLPTPIGVAPCQPNPHRGSLKTWGMLAGGFLAADLAITAAGAAAGNEAWTFPCCMTVPALLLPLIVQWTRSSNFERERWEESDHPGESISFGTDEDGEPITPMKAVIFVLGILFLAFVVSFLGDS